MAPFYLLRLFAETCQANSGFFDLPTWYMYLDGVEDSFGKCVPTFSMSNPQDLWAIGLAGIDIMLGVAGLVAVGFIIYGGFQYVTSAGEPDRTKGAKESILNALIGLVITIVASSVVAFIGNSIK